MHRYLRYLFRFLSMSCFQRKQSLDQVMSDSSDSLLTYSTEDKRTDLWRCIYKLTACRFLTFYIIFQTWKHIQNYIAAHDGVFPGFQNRTSQGDVLRTLFMPSLLSQKTNLQNTDCTRHLSVGYPLEVFPNFQINMPCAHSKNVNDAVMARGCSPLLSSTTSLFSEWEKRKEKIWWNWVFTFTHKRGRCYRKWREWCWVGYKTSTWYGSSLCIRSLFLPKMNHRLFDVPKVLRACDVFCVV